MTERIGFEVVNPVYPVRRGEQGGHDRCGALPYDAP